jgi:hypothetical protein
VVSVNGTPHNRVKTRTGRHGNPNVKSSRTRWYNAFTMTQFQEHIETAAVTHDQAVTTRLAQTGGRRVDATAIQPDEFFNDVTKRTDVREILKRLAK